MKRTKQPHSVTQVTFPPSLIVRSALVMSVFVVVSCLSLTSGMTPANADTPQESVVQPPADAGISSPSNTSASESSAVECQVSEQYPGSVRQWCGWITQYANQYELSPDLIAGLIWYESGGDPGAYSRSGAVGLMQVMPRDGLAAEFQCVNGPCFASRPTIAELSEAEYNIMYGTRMLAGLLARYQDLRAALRAYGPKDVGYTYADKLLAIYESYRSD